VIVNELAADTFTMKSAFVVPMFPSITEVSWIESVGNCASAADERRTPNARISQGRGDVLMETVQSEPYHRIATSRPIETEKSELPRQLEIRLQ
jgi:hypothetical protein